MARQYFRYGWGKADMLYANRTLPSIRPLAPLGLILGLVGTAVLGAIAGIWWPLLALLTAWGAVLLWVGGSAGGGIPHRLRTMGVAAIMQLSFGIGLVTGVGRGPGSRRHLQL